MNTVVAIKEVWWVWEYSEQAKHLVEDDDSIFSLFWCEDEHGRTYKAYNDFLLYQFDTKDEALAYLATLSPMDPAVSFRNSVAKPVCHVWWNELPDEAALLHCWSSKHIIGAAGYVNHNGVLRRFVYKDTARRERAFRKNWGANPVSENWYPRVYDEALADTEAVIVKPYAKATLAELLDERWPK